MININTLLAFFSLIMLKFYKGFQMKNYILKVTMVIVVGILISGCSSRVNPPILSGSQNGNLTQVKNEIRKGIYIDQRGINNYTPLLQASAAGKLHIVKYLVENGADVRKTTRWGSSSLERASSNGHLNVVKYLLKQKNVDINQQNIYKNTALHIATHKVQYDVVKYLVEQGANRNIVNSSGYTPLGLAIRDKRTKIRNYFENIDKNRVYEKKVIADKNIILGHQKMINGFVEKKDFEGLKKYIELYPKTVSYIQDENVRLLFTGPVGMKIGDIKRHIEKKRSETIIISLIKRVRTPYKVFTLDEIDTLSSMGISDNIISTMMDVTTEILKKEDEKKEQQNTREVQKTKVIYKEKRVNTQRNTKENNPVVDKVQDELIKQGAKMLFDKLF